MKNVHKCILILFGFYCVLFLSGCQGKGINTDQNIKTANGQNTSNESNLPSINFAEMSLYFIANKGQVNDKVKFYAKASKYTLWLTKEGMFFDTVKRTPQKGLDKECNGYRRGVSNLVFVNANPEPEMISVGETDHQVNYFIGNDRSKWYSNIPSSQAVFYKNLYQGIDLKVYGVEKQIEYDWIVRPGEDPGLIRFAYKGIKGTRIDDTGNLLIETDAGELIHNRPFTYQEIDGERVVVEAEYWETGENSYGFIVGKYNKNYRLTIDPVVLAYSTYLGGNCFDDARSIASDNSGNVYVTGLTLSTNFPIKNQYQVYQGGSDTVEGGDTYITKIDTTEDGAASLVYSTYLGGGDNDRGIGIATDNEGNVYVTGDTRSTDFPTKNQYQTYQGAADAFITKIDTTQSGAASLVYSTYLGGDDSDYGDGIATDNGGNVYVTGHTSSTDFPIKNQYQTYQGAIDAFITKIDTTQSGAASLVYSTYLGGGDMDRSRGIATDNGGNVYVTGRTESTDFPIKNQYQTYQGAADAFITKIDTTQSGAASLVYSTYLGGDDSDLGYGIATDNGGNVYVTGSAGTDFPIKNQYQTYQDAADAFITKIDTTQSGAASLLYSTYLGGDDTDRGYGIATDNGGNVYVTGRTSSTDFPIKNQYQTYQGADDAFITKIDTTEDGAASLVYSTYLGGGDNDRGIGIATDNGGNVYVTGRTSSTDFPIQNQYQIYYDGDDAFITKLSFSEPGPFDLSVILAGHGTVTSVPAGIDCPGSCTETYDKGTSVTLKAVPAEGAIFGSWSGGGCSGTATCTVSIDKDLKVTATFGKKGVVGSWLMLLLK